MAMPHAKAVATNALMVAVVIGGLLEQSLQQQKNQWQTAEKCTLRRGRRRASPKLCLWLGNFK
jgi:hypothetical protein